MACRRSAKLHQCRQPIVRYLDNTQAQGLTCTPVRMAPPLLNRTLFNTYCSTSTDEILHRIFDSKGLAAEGSLDGVSLQV